MRSRSKAVPHRADAAWTAGPHPSPLPRGEGAGSPAPAQISSLAGRAQRSRVRGARARLTATVALTGLLILLAVALSAQTPPGYFSPVAVATLGEQQAIVAGDGLRVVDLAAQRVSREIPMPSLATDLAVSMDGKVVYVTCGEADGRLVVADVANGKIRQTIVVGHSPTAPVASADPNLVYIANRFLHRLAVVDLRAGRVVRTIPVEREPVAMAIVPGAGKLLVANHLPAMRADGAHAEARLSVVDPKAGRQVATIPLPNGSTSVRGLAVSPDGKFAYVTHILARFQLPTTQLDRGWMNTNAVSVIDLASLQRVNTFLLDSVEHGAANPWGVGCSPDGQALYVASAGTHELHVIDRAALHRRLETAADGRRVTEATSCAEDVPNDLGFLSGIRRRVALPGRGPRGIAVTAQGVVAAEYFSDALTVLAGDAVMTVALAPAREMTPERLGELYFHDATLCSGQWQSCSSCHPDARADALNWDLLNDGIGNPKQTKSMLLAHRTPPAMLAGVRGSAEVAVRAGLRHIQFAVRPEADAQAIDSYLRSLQPYPSPERVNGRLTAAAKRGEKLFQQAGCGKCHSGPLYTNLQSYDVGTATAGDPDRPLDTPTLVEVWRTAPYLSDGRAATLAEVVGGFNRGDRHGQTSKLTAAQRADLVAYLRTL